MHDPRARRRLALAAALTLGLAGCGRAAAPPPGPALTVYLPSGPAAAGWLPLYLAFPEGSARWRRQPVPPHPAGSWLAVVRPYGPLPGPVTGYLTERSGAVLLGPAPAAELGFRWTALRELPLAWAGTDAFTLRLLQGILTEHRVRPPLLEALPLAAAPGLLSGGHLPLVLVPLAAVPRFGAAPALAFLGASTGPAPTWVLTGGGPGLPGALARINRALEELHTSRPRDLALRAAPRYGQTPAAAAAWIRTGLALGVWPRLSYPFPSSYRRGLEVLGRSPEALPPFDRAAAARALERWP